MVAEFFINVDLLRLSYLTLELLCFSANILFFFQFEWASAPTNG